MTPIFLFSLPRAGSTLLQRILGAHEEIATASEPWILLPLFYSLKSGGVYSEYGHSNSVLAIEDFCRELPGGQVEYRRELHDLAMRLYEKAAKRPARYFLDKTPRYHLIADEIIDTFPEAKFIFLWRNPLAVVGSVVETLLNGRWMIYDYKIDLYDGVENLLRAKQRAGNKAMSLRYEDLLEHGEQSVTDLLAFLDVPQKAELLKDFTSVKLQGRLGDYGGTKTYSSVSREPLDKWKTILNNPLRQAWARRYLTWIGPERMKSMGYNLDSLLDELDGVPLSMRNVLPDIFRSVSNVFSELAEPEILKRKIGMIDQWHKVHVHR